MHDKLGLAGRCGFTLLAITTIGLPIALFSKSISIEVFVVVTTIWLLVSAMLILGESVTEVKFWKTSIKRDVKAARLARDEAEAIRDQIRKVAELNVENVYLLNSLVSGIYKGGVPDAPAPPAINYISENLTRMTPIISTDPSVITAWQQRMRDVIRQ
jgi:hypothetical protein